MTQIHQIIHRASHIEKSNVAYLRKMWALNIVDNIEKAAQKNRKVAADVMEGGGMVITDNSHNVDHYTLGVFDLTGYYVGGAHLFEDKAATFQSQQLDGRSSKYRRGKKPILNSWVHIMEINVQNEQVAE
ncbi:hypothetical protein CVT25_008023 [Psilocybe cyanescens]|uniref:Uncharacterized protein n=1 Tax=Psilocybe cyanescens TaxID=93625 RepID=A0A409XTL8_PSICY|nr:hypothetical protein CVT25_008023 [Psilocybe cyanescens]